MKTVVLACQSLQNEVKLAMKRANFTLPLVILEENNHDVPTLLRENIQRKLDTLTQYDRVILAFGTCGGAMVGLKTGNFELILPRVDDCLSILMGSMERRQEVLEGGFGIFLTDRWLLHEKNMRSELDRIEKRYSPEQAKKVIAVMYGKFDSLNVIDTGAYDVPSILPQTKALAQRLNLTHRIQQGTTAYLEELLTGPWPKERFIRIAPQTAVTGADTLMPSLM